MGKSRLSPKVRKYRSVPWRGEEEGKWVGVIFDGPHRAEGMKVGKKKENGSVAEIRPPKGRLK